MRPLILVDLEALYEKYVDGRDVVELDFLKVAEKIAEIRANPRFANYELKFFGRAEARVLGPVANSSESSALNDKPAWIQVDSNIQHAEKFSNVLAPEAVAPYLSGRNPVLVISPDQVLLATLPPHVAKCPVSAGGELILPSEDWLAKLDGLVDFIFDTDDTLLLRASSLLAKERQLNPHLLTLIEALLEKQASDDVDFAVTLQQMTSRYQDLDQGEAHLFSGASLVLQMREWLATKGVDAQEIERYDLIYTNADHKLKFVHARYETIHEHGGYQALSQFCVLVDDNSSREFESGEAKDYLNKIQSEFELPVHLIRVRLAGEFLQDGLEVFNQFLERYTVAPAAGPEAVAVGSASGKGAGLFAGSIKRSRFVDEDSSEEDEAGQRPKK